VIGLGPIAWIIAAVVAVGAAMVWAYNNVSWFHDGVDWLWTQTGIIFAQVWNAVIAPVFRFLVDAVANVTTVFGNMLLALGQVPGFGWATDAGKKVLDTAGQVRGLSQSIKDIPDGHSTIYVTANYSPAVEAALAAQRAGVKLSIIPNNAAGGTYGPSQGGTVVRVAEAGRAETIVDTATLNAAMAQKQKSTNEGGTVIHNWYVTGATPEALYAQFKRRDDQMAAV
jgi:hypothetical protein